MIDHLCKFHILDLLHLYTQYNNAVLEYGIKDKYIKGNIIKGTMSSWTFLSEKEQLTIMNFAIIRSRNAYYIKLAEIKREYDSHTIKYWASQMNMPDQVREALFKI